MRRSSVSSREVEVDGELTIELLVDGVVRGELVWSGIPSPGEHAGWTLVTPDRREPWPWDAGDERELANMEDALRDHCGAPTARSEMRVHFWDRRARDASAVGAAAWGRERLT